MPLVLANRVQESATANTTVSFTLTGAIAGFQTFAVIGNTNTTYYSATDGAGNWEVGLGTYSTTGPTLTRTTVYASSNSNLAVTFSGTVNVFVTYPSGRSVNLDASGNLIVANDATISGLTVGRGAGAISDNTAIGASALQANTFGGGNVAVGYQASYSSTGSYNAAIGYQAAYNNTSQAYNSAFGYQAMFRMQANYNIGIGYQALYGGSGIPANNTGGSNIAIGIQSLYSGITANLNVALGYYSMYSTQSGVGNVSIGYASLYENQSGGYSTAIGRESMYYMRGSGFNTAVGYNSLRGSLTPASNTGVYNTAIGVNALQDQSTSNYNTAVGMSAGSLITAGSYNTIVGGYNGNQNNLDIRTASNYAVLSDGAGNRIISGGSGVSVALGNSAVPQSGTGITFPATQSSSSNVNTLDDYEEGTFTPSLQGSTGTGSVTYAARAGHYTKIGDLVYATVWIQLNSGSFTGTMQVGGLPFTVRNATNNYAPISIGYVDLYAYAQYYQLMGYANVNTTTVILTQAFSNTASSNAPVDTSFAIMFSVTYKTAT